MVQIESLQYTRIRRALSIALVALLLIRPAFSLAEVNRISDTTATVSFIEGDLEMVGDVEGSGLDFDFGSHTIPVVGTSYGAQNLLEHFLQVADSRYDSGDWQVTVSLTSFSGDNSAFDAVIRLQNPVVSNANESTGTDGLQVESLISIASGGDTVPVMTADGMLGRGRYTAHWTNENVTLNISDGEVGNIAPESYGAKLTWTLSLGPS